MTESAPKFSDFELAPELRRALEEQGYDTPTPIQAEAIPALLEGRDVLGQAQTGTGKTAAFALPMLQRLDPHQTSVQAIVLAPTRELALQVNEAVRTYGKFLGKNGVRSLAVYGGQPIHIQLKHLSRGVQVVIGTPGRVKDHLERKTLDLSGVRFFGLDEADEMLKMGFIEDVEWILEQAPPERQIALFSATLPGPIKRVAERYLKNFVDVHVAAEARSIDTIEQFCMRVSGRRKLEALERVLEAEDYEAVLVFCRTQRNCAELTEQLQASGYQADCVHGGMSQAQREQVVGRLRRRALQIVVATDVAARGLDIDHISLVINYDLPRDAEVYVHRIGRTGRAGRTGRSIAFWLPRERRLLKGFEHYAGQPMTLMPVPTSADIEGQRRRRFAAEVRRLSAEDLPEFTALVHKLCGEEGLDVVRVAAAGLKLAWGDHPLTPTASIRPTPRPEIAFAPAAPAGATPPPPPPPPPPGTDAIEEPVAPSAPAPAPPPPPPPPAPAQPEPVPAAAAPRPFLAPAPAQKASVETRPARPPKPAKRAAEPVRAVAEERPRRPEPARAERAAPRDEPRPAPVAQRPPRQRFGADAETQLLLQVGKRNRLRPGDVVGAITNEANLPGEVIGAINIQESVTFVSVAEQHAPAILEALQGARIRGRVINPRRAEPRENAGGRPHTGRGHPASGRRARAQRRRGGPPPHRTGKRGT